MASSSASSGTILIVDDQEQNIQVAGATLSAFAYEIMVATGGEQALQRVAARIPDLILLDILMPDMDGFAVCAALKKDPEFSGIPIIFLSANDDKNVIVRALEAGGVDYVTKPFNKAELIARVRTHIDLKHARDELQDLLEKREEFIGIMAHDLKNPLSGIQFSAQLLNEMKDKLPPPADKLAANIAEATDKTMGLITEFLTEFRESQTDLEVELCNLDLVSIVNEAISRSRLLADRKTIEIKSVLPDNPVVARVDHFAAGRVLDNLVSNAIKFTESGKTISIELLPGTLEVKVKDEGPGISDDDRSKLFEQFTRLSAVPTDGETTTGLGLSIAKKLAEMMHAELRADENSPSGGACFVIKFEKP